jgi:arsenate reductase
MAEGFLKNIAGDKFDIYSAGTHPASFGITEGAIVVMEEVEIDITDQWSKSLEDIPLPEMDYIVTMGCGVECPFYPGVEVIEWDIHDPYGEGIEVFREVRDTIMKKVQELKDELLAKVE